VNTKYHPFSFQFSRFLTGDNGDQGILAEKATTYRESWLTSESSAQPYVFALLVATGLLLELVLHFYLHVTVVYTQFFYLIVVIAGLWYGKKAIWVALLFGGLQIIVGISITGSFPFDSLMRAAMLFVVAYVVGTLAEWRDACHYEVVDRNSELNASQQAFEIANKKLNLLSSITRHDIFNQLTVLLGYLDLAREKVTDPELTRYIKKSEDAANIIRRQIAFTKDYQDIGVQAPQWQGLTRCIETISELTPMHDVRRTVDLGTLEIYGDPMLEKVFGNLIDNSLRHGEHVTLIRFSYRESEDAGLVIVYEDNGAGVSEEDKERIFQKGFGKNTGFGLFLSSEILGITGLSIKENGLPGEGARFEISVPKGKFRFP
jgi:signal transduction histidine kinase